MPTRRNFLRAVAGAGVLRAGAAHADVSRNIGLQLYTVRDPLTSDFEATLRKIARLGYREVEFAGILVQISGRRATCCSVSGLLHHHCIAATAAYGRTPRRPSIRRMRSAQNLLFVHGWSSRSGRRLMIGSAFLKI